MPAVDDSKETQLNAIANFLGHHKTGRTGVVNNLYPEIFKYISEDYPHVITDLNALIQELRKVAQMPVNNDNLRSST